MAEHELNKIVDDEGEVFNLRDSTKLSYFDATYVRNNASGDGWVKLADIDSATRSSVDKNAAWDVVLVTANTGIWRESITLDVRFNSSGSGMPKVILFNRKAELSTRTAFNFCVKVVGLAGSGNTTVELWAYAAKGWYSIGIREAGADNITKKKNWNYYSYSSDGGSSKPVADAGNNVQVVDPAYVDIDYRTIMQDVSKGANLVVNGSGTMCSNYNWPDFTWVGDYATDASAGAFRRSFNGNDNVFRSCTEYIAINPSRKIDVSVDFNVLSAAVSCTMRMAIGFYDIDKNGISALDVMYGAGTCTTLARDLNPGDTVVYLTSVANWTNDIGQDYKRGFIFWDYANSYGYVYPPETYSRNHYTNWFDSADSVNPTNNTITLNKAWTGLAKVAGTKVSKCDSGATYNYLDNKIVATTEVGTWFNLHAIIKGMSTTGTNPSDKIRQGAAFVKVGFLNTSSNANYTYVFTNYRVYEIPDSAEKIRTARKLAVSLSNTSTDTSFDGSADVTNIKTTGTLGIEYGGTGATTKKAAEYAINGGMPESTSQPGNDYQFVFSRVGSDQSAKNGVFLFRKASLIWSWIKGKLTSDSGVNISGSSASCTGNAATATTATKINVGTQADGSTYKVIGVNGSSGNLSPTSLTNIYAYKNSGGNQFYIGKADGSGTEYKGILKIADGTAHAMTLDTATLTADRSIHFPDSSGTVALQSGTYSGMTVGTATSANNGVAYIAIGSTSSADVLAAFNAGKTLIGHSAMTISGVQIRTECQLIRVEYTDSSLATVSAWVFGYTDVSTSGSEGTMYTIKCNNRSTQPWDLTWSSKEVAIATTARNCSGNSATATVSSSCSGNAATATNATYDADGAEIKTSYICDARVADNPVTSNISNMEFSVLDDASVKTDDASIGNRKYVQLRKTKFKIPKYSGFTSVLNPVMGASDYVTVYYQTDFWWTLGHRGSIADTWGLCSIANCISNGGRLVEVDFDVECAPVSSQYNTIPLQFCLARCPLTGSFPTGITDGSQFSLACLQFESTGSTSIWYRHHMHMIGVIPSTISNGALCIGCHSIINPISVNVKVSNVYIKSTPQYNVY